MAVISAIIPQKTVKIYSLVLLVILLALFFTPVLALTEIWNDPVTVDNSTNVGYTLSLAEVNGLPAISYFDYENGNLKYVQASNSEGSAWGTSQVLSDTVGSGGDSSLLVLSGSQYPAISFYDINLGDLKYVRATDIDGSSWNAPLTIDSTGDVGQDTHMRIVQGRPAISYYDNENYRLKYVRADDAYGDSWGTPIVVDESSDMGIENSLAVVNGYPAISYYDYDNGQLMYIQSDSIDGSTWNKSAVIVDTTNDVGDYNALAVVDGRPAITYYDADQGSLKYIRANDINGDDWPASPILLDNDGDTGVDSSLAVINGVPAVSYWDPVHGFLKYIKAEDAVGDTWGAPITLDNSGQVGDFRSLKSVNGLPAIAYYNDVLGNLKFISKRGTVDIIIQDGSVVIADGSGSVDFGTAPQGTPVTKMLVIYNQGTTDLDLSMIQVPNGFSLAGGYAASIPAGSSENLQIRLDAFSQGAFSGTFSITNQDSEKSPYDFELTGEVSAGASGSLETSLLAPVNGSVVINSPIQIAFNQSVKSGGGSKAADNPDNYLLVEAGSNNIFDTASCALGAAGDDVPVSISSVTYDGSNYTATLNFAALPSGLYQLLVCGTTSIESLSGNLLNDGLSDSRTRFTVISTSSDGNTGSETGTSSLPATGFIPGQFTRLPDQPESLAYDSMEDLSLRIPQLGIELPIIGIPQTESGWDVTWLSKSQTGWLNGSAFPTWEGNTVLTGHVTDASGMPGPFAKLNTLKYGDTVIIEAYGQTYTYEVRENILVLPGNTSSVLDHRELDWVSLVTCEYYNKLNGEYLFRRVVRAILVNVE